MKIHEKGQKCLKFSFSYPLIMHKRLSKLIILMFPNTEPNFRQKQQIYKKKLKKIDENTYFGSEKFILTKAL